MATVSGSNAPAMLAEQEVLAGNRERGLQLWRALVAQQGEAAVARLRIGAHAHFRRGDWRAAHDLYAVLAALRPRYRHLQRRAAWCLDNAEAFAAAHLTPAHRDRVLAVLRDSLPQAADLVTEKSGGGLNSLCNFRHRVLDRDGRTIAGVFEKSFLGTEARSFARVRLFFAEHAAEAFLAPRYYGVVRHGPFRAVLQETIDGEPPSPERWLEVRRQVMARLWQQAPGAAVRTAWSGTRLRNLVERVRSPGILMHTATWWPAATPREWLQIACGRRFSDWVAPHLPPSLRTGLRGSRDAIARRLQRLPLFVMHADLHAGNVLVEHGSGRLWTIDWDRWTAEPVGSGWPVEPSAADDPVPGLDAALSGGRFATAPPDRGGAILAALAWDLRESFKQGRFARLEPLAELMLRQVRDQSAPGPT